jgi:hypothetical protein
MGWGRSQILRRRESLVLYKSFSILSNKPSVYDVSDEQLRTGLDIGAFDIKLKGAAVSDRASDEIFTILLIFDARIHPSWLAYSRFMCQFLHF